MTGRCVTSPVCDIQCAKTSES